MLSIDDPISISEFQYFRFWCFDIVFTSHLVKIITQNLVKSNFSLDTGFSIHRLFNGFTVDFLNSANYHDIKHGKF